MTGPHKTPLAATVLPSPDELAGALRPAGATIHPSVNNTKLAASSLSTVTTRLAAQSVRPAIREGR